MSTVEFNTRLGFRASWTPVEVIDYIAKWWQIKSFRVFMIFTLQCLVSRCKLAKIDPINIKSKQLYRSHFGIRCIVWWRTQNILSGNKVEIESEWTFYWHHVPQDEIEQDIETRERSKLRPRLHRWGRILLQIAVRFARVHRNFCTVSASEWLFWISSALHWTNHGKLSPDCDNSEFTQQDGRKRRKAKRVCVTNVTGLCHHHISLVLQQILQDTVGC